MRKKLIPTITCLLSILFLFPFRTIAQTEVDSIGPQYDFGEIESFLDGVIETHMKEKTIAGASLAIVTKDSLAILKGYGYTDVDANRKVDASSSLFRIGSVSKLFVWISIMQLVEQNKISLDDNVNNYFDEFQIPEAYGEPVTIKHLMTHTPGFEDLVIELFAKDSTFIVPLSNILQKQLPKRVRPPGTDASYSNHGTGMAALIVEKVSGQTFIDYVNSNILTPLGMSSTSFRQPLESSLQNHMSKGYLNSRGELVEKPFEYVPLAPVGAAASSASDMARLLRMFLNQGSLGDTEIMSSETFEIMASPAHQHHERVNPMRYGLMDVSQNGVTIIGHGGDTFWFHTLFVILPEKNLGIFLSFNTDTGGGTYLKVLEAFVDKYFNESVEDLEEAPKADLLKYEGVYLSNRHPHGDIFEISKLMGPIEVSVTEDGLLKTSSEDSWYYESGNVFRHKYSSETLVFKENQTGEITTVYLGGLPIIAYDKVSGLATPGAQLTILLISLGVIVITFIYWTLLFFIRRRLFMDHRPGDSLSYLQKGIGWFTMASIIVFLIGAAMIFSNPFELVFGIPGSLKLILFLPFLTIILCLLMVYQIYLIWRNKEVRMFSRIWYIILWLSSVSILIQLNHWNFLGWNY